MGGIPEKGAHLLKGLCTCQNPWDPSGTYAFCPDARLKQDASVGRRGRGDWASERVFWEMTRHLSPQPAHGESWASGDLLTRLDGQEVVQLVQHLQQGRLLLGLTELEGHGTSSQQGGVGEGGLSV